jgi:NhaP-type Na+/H+ or K+/H+ antiporter
VALLAARLRHDGALLPRLAFDPAAFFTYLLPPIIFNAGLSVEKSFFFRHLDRIMLLGVVGTLLNFALIAGGVAAAVSWLGGFPLSMRDCLAIGAVFGATDTVATLQVLDAHAAPVLFSLVLGEGCVNDAMSLVLLRAVEALPDGSSASADFASLAIHFLYLFVCSTALGLLVGLAAAAAARLVSHPGANGAGVDDSVALEVAVIGVLAYISFLLAEACHLSGILALFAAALAVSHYGMRCLSRAARSTTAHAFATLSFVCEQLIFLYTGLAALDRAAWTVARPTEVLALLGTLGALLLGARALTVAVVTAIGNRIAGRRSHMGAREAMVVWWAGLMRGAVSVAIATHHFAVVAPGAPRLPPPLPGSPEAEELRTHASVIATSFIIVLIRRAKLCMISIQTDANAMRCIAAAGTCVAFCSHRSAAPSASRAAHGPSCSACCPPPWRAPLRPRRAAASGATGEKMMVCHARTSATTRLAASCRGCTACGAPRTSASWCRCWAARRRGRHRSRRCDQSAARTPSCCRARDASCSELGVRMQRDASV